MTLEWIEWGKTIRDLAVHLGGEIPIGAQLELGKCEWRNSDETVLLGDVQGAPRINTPEPCGYDFWGAESSDDGEGDQEFGGGDIVKRYRIWPVGEDVAP